MTSSLIQTLESRTFLSATPVLFNTTVQADRTAIHLDLLKFESDAILGTAQLVADHKSVHSALAKGDTSLEAPFAKLTADNKALAVALKADNLAESAAALADESVIKLDILQIIKDKGNKTAEAADHTKLMTDRITLQNALIAGLDSRVATRTAYETTISTDTAAIVTAADNDPAATAKLKAAVTIFATQRNSLVATLAADLATIAAARTKLVADLTALQMM
jgi:hypothetical protein